MRQTSWATLWRLEVTLLPNNGQLQNAKDDHPLDWWSCDFSFEACFGRNPHAYGVRHLAGGINAELRSLKAFGQWVNIIRKASPKTPSPEHALYAARKIVAFI